MKIFRKNYFINPEFQLKLILLSFIPILLTLAIFYFQSIDSIREVKVLASNLPEENKASAIMMLETQEVLLGKYFFWSSIVVFFITGLILVVISHKMAGPIFRLEKHLEEINETGEVKLIRFRKNDYLQNIELQINKTFSKHQDYPNFDEKKQ